MIPCIVVVHTLLPVLGQFGGVVEAVPVPASVIVVVCAHAGAANSIMNTTDTVQPKYPSHCSYLTILVGDVGNLLKTKESPPPAPLTLLCGLLSLGGCVTPAEVLRDRLAGV